MEKKANHQANIVRIEEILPHTNADTLELIKIGGYQVVSKKGQFKVGDLGVYIQPDSVVPQTEPFRFIWEPYVQVSTDPAGHAQPYEVPERRRRITVRKFRGEWSEGLLLPVSDFSGGLVHKPEMNYGWLEPGQDVSDLLGITHYDPDKGVENTKGENVVVGPRRRYPKTLKGWFFFLIHKLGFKAGRVLTEEVGFELPVYDVDALKNYRGILQPGETVFATEKIHGSNARFVFLDGKMYAGSRTLWKAEKSNCVWRKALKQNPWIEGWCRDHEGYALYGEVVLTQKGFNYGCKDGEVKFFPFDIRTPDGRWAQQWREIKPGGITVTELWDSVPHHVPTLGCYSYDEASVKSVADGPSQVSGAKHIREGVVIRPVQERRVPGLGRVILKVVSNAFLEKDSK